MNIRDLARSLLGLATRALDSDGDGKLEISDLPGALAKVAAMQAHGEALVAAAKATVGAYVAAAKAGNVTTEGRVITAEEVSAAYERARAPWRTTAAEARAEQTTGQEGI